MIEEIRTRHEACLTPTTWAAGTQAHTDRATLLKEHDRQQYAIQIKNNQIEELEELLDAAREELAEVREAAADVLETIDHYGTSHHRLAAALKGT
jgi:uncharacterized protein YdeI (YjbR/CyaY-like superfamily)